MRQQMRSKRKEKHINSLFVRIIIVVTTGILCLSLLLTGINITLSKEVFAENFAESQQKIFNQIDLEFYDFYKDIADIMTVVSTSDVVREYMTDRFGSQEEERADILEMKKLIDKSAFSEHTELNMVILSMAGKSYIHNSSDAMTEKASELLQSQISREVVEEPKFLASRYLERGFTEIMKKSPVVVFAKAILNPDSGKMEGIIYITIKESDFRGMYNYFTSNSSKILVFNQNRELLSASEEEYFHGENMREILQVMDDMEMADVKHLTQRQSGEVKSYQMQNLQNTRYKLIGIINPEDAFGEQYHVGVVLFITVVISMLVAVIIFYLIRSQTRPIYRLADTMSKVREGNLKEYVQVKGTQEVRQLSQAYNDMIWEIEQYVEKIYRIEEEKRTAEIHALQMQINPHYMYNTLASIKWLALQGNVQKTTQVIDAFIFLLRNTISNTAEFITVDSEIQNLKNYVLINQVRYGDNVNVEFFVPPQCGGYKLPKLILQPFVENAFFHGFPEGKKGTIQIFVKKEGGYLRFDIVDDGIGMNAEKLMALKNKDGHKGEHFTGIGINNVDDRVKMIYGVDYGINIISEENQGTTVIIRLPLRK